MDVEDMVAGEVWRETIERALHSCRVGVVLIGNRWLDTDPRRGRPRLHDESDTVRMEIRRLLEVANPSSSSWRAQHRPPLTTYRSICNH